MFGCYLQKTTRVKDRGDCRLQERRISLACIEALLLAVCKHFGLP